MVSVLMAVVVTTTVASGSSFSYSAAVAVAITTDVAAADAVAMIAAAAKSGLTTIYKRDIGQNDCPVSTECGQQEQFCWYFFTKNQ